MQFAVRKAIRLTSDSDSNTQTKRHAWYNNNTTTTQHITTLSDGHVFVRFHETVPVHRYRACGDVGPLGRRLYHGRRNVSLPGFLQSRHLGERQPRPAPVRYYSVLLLRSKRFSFQIEPFLCSTLCTENGATTTIQTQISDSCVVLLGSFGRSRYEDDWGERYQGGRIKPPPVFFWRCFLFA